MAKISAKGYAAELARFEEEAGRAAARSDEVVRRAEKWLAARARGDEVAAAAVEREDPPVARRLRAFEREVTLPADATARAATFGRLHDALLGEKLQYALREVVDETCPLCASLGVGH